MPQRYTDSAKEPKVYSLQGGRENPKEKKCAPALRQGRILYLR